jgi:hypothetical protein
MWHYAIFKGVSKYVALAKQEPFISDPIHPFYEPGDLWFEFGETPGEAMTHLKASLVIDGFDISGDDGT